MGLIYLLVVLASGHIFSLLHLPARYRLRVSDGWEAYFHVGAHGVVMVTVAFVFYWLSYTFFEFSIPGMEKAVLNGFPLASSEMELAFIALLSLLLAAGLGLASHLWLRNESRRIKAKRKLVVVDPIEFMLFSSLHSGSEDLHVLITLENNKVYVGRVVDHSIEHGLQDSFAIIPFLSGYRTSLKTVKFSINYTDHYKEAGFLVKQGDRYVIADDLTKRSSLDYFKVVIRKSQVITVSYFDVAVYNSIPQPDIDE